MKTLKPNHPEAPVPKFRVSLSIPEMDQILEALSSQGYQKVLENAALIGWIQKQKLKAEVGISSPSHSTVGARSLGFSQTQAVVQKTEEGLQKQAWEAYSQEAEMSEEEIILALKYKMNHSLECGSLSKEEEEVMNEWLARNI